MFQNKGLLSWFFQRITALILVFGLIVHFIVLHFMIERPVTMEKVARRLEHPGWIAFDCVLLLACLYHALNGLNSVLLDFKPARTFKNIVYYALWVAGGATAAIGIANLIPFGR